MNILVENRKALFNYEVIDKLEAGIVLFGYEVKAIKEGKANIRSSFVSARNGKAVIKNLQINRYSKSRDKIEPGRDKVLLLHKNEIEKLVNWEGGGSQTIVPLSLYEKDNKIKLSIAMVKGKKQYEKRQSLKEKDVKRSLQRKFKTR